MTKQQFDWCTEQKLRSARPRGYKKFMLNQLTMIFQMLIKTRMLKNKDLLLSNCQMYVA